MLYGTKIVQTESLIISRDLDHATGDLDRVETSLILLRVLDHAIGDLDRADRVFDHL